MAAKKRSRRNPPTPPRPPSSTDPPPVGPVSEYRSYKDDAWYSVNLLLHANSLFVKFREFTSDADDVFHVDDLKTSDDIRSFRQRFRPLNKQLEASDCGVVRQGMKVCGLRVFSEDDRRFYDAVVDGVKREEHGVEKCSCSILLSWLHGPEAGKLALASVEDLCPIQTCQQLDIRVACFLQIAEWKNGLISPCSGLTSSCMIKKSEKQIQIGSDLSDEGQFGYERNEDVDLGGGDFFFDVICRNKEDLSCAPLARRECSHKHLLEKKASCLNGGKEELMEDVSDIDLGWGDDVETDARYFVLIDNMEKDVCPSTVVDFIRHATSLEIEAFVFMSSSMEAYTRGALVVKSVDELELLCGFLSKPDQIITSSKGRPWIVSETSTPDMVRTSFWCLEPDFDFENKRRQHLDGDELKILKLGSNEYGIAKELRDLFMEFAEHQQGLFKRFAFEEEKILAKLKAISNP